MRTISASLLLLAATPAAADLPVSAAECPAHLGTIAPKLKTSGYQLSWTGSALLRAAHVAQAGRVTIEYRCDAKGLSVAVLNQGLPDIPFHVLLAAGPGATLREDVPALLRERQKAVRD
jgi:hypothetical protein